MIIALGWIGRRMSGQHIDNFQRGQALPCHFLRHRIGVTVCKMLVSPCLLRMVAIVILRGWCARWCSNTSGFGWDRVWSVRFAVLPILPTTGMHLRIFYGWQRDWVYGH